MSQGLSLVMSSTGPAAMAHCKTEQDDWLLAHLKYLLFIFNFFFWVSAGYGTPLPTPIVWPYSLPRLASPKLMTMQGPMMPCCSEPSLPWL